jgi:hypothetical protein
VVTGALSFGVKKRGWAGVFRSLFNKVKSKLTGIVLSYVEWAAVGVPFIVAMGFALAAIHAMLIEEWGRVVANWAMAGGLAAIGAGGALAVKLWEQHDLAAEDDSHAGIFPSLSPAAPSTLIHAVPIALNLVSRFPTKASRMGRLAREHAPLLAFAGLITLLFWPTPIEHSTEPNEERDRHPLDEERIGVPAAPTLAMRVASQKLLADPLF